MGGFVRENSSDSYVLLGGGGHKLESDLSVNYAGAATTATQATNLTPENTPHYFRDPNSAAWRGGMFWGSAGSESMSFVVANSVTRFQFVGGSDIASWGSSTWQSANPYFTISSNGATIEKLDSKNSRRLLFKSGADTGDIHLWGEGHMFSFAIDTSSGSGVLGILPNHIYTNRVIRSDGGFIHNSYDDSSYVLLSNGGASQLKTINGTSIFGSGNITINAQSVHYGYDDGFWETIPYTGGDGVIEIGKYVDWHETKYDSRDYSYRMESKNGTIYCTGSLSATGFNNISDIRKKNILSYIDIDINNIARAPIFNFTWNDNKINNYYNIRVGTSAQYWKTFLPWVVNITQDSIGTLSLQYDVAALVSAISIAKKTVEQEHKINMLESEVQELKNKINELINK